STRAPIGSGISLTALRRRRRLTLRWSRRRSARVRPSLLAVRRKPVGSRFSAALAGTPRGLPRLPMGASPGGRRVRRRGGDARVRVGAVQPPRSAERPDDAVRPADQAVGGAHAAAGPADAAGRAAGGAAVVAEDEQAAL